MEFKAQELLTHDSSLIHGSQRQAAGKSPVKLKWGKYLSTTIPNPDWGCLF